MKQVRGKKPCHDKGQPSLNFLERIYFGIIRRMPRCVSIAAEIGPGRKHRRGGGTELVRKCFFCGQCLSVCGGREEAWERDRRKEERGENRSGKGGPEGRHKNLIREMLVPGDVRWSGQKGEKGGGRGEDFKRARATVKCFCQRAIPFPLTWDIGGMFLGVGEGRG